MKRKQTLKNLTKALALAGIAAMPFVSNAQVKFSGQVFGDYAYKLHSDSISNRVSKATYADRQAYQGFDIRRVYLTADYDINSKVHVNVNLANEGNVLGDGSRAFYLKGANITFKDIFTGSNLIIGQQTTPTFATTPGSESTWGYRFVEKTIMDMRGIASSNDLGVGLEGKYMDGNFGYNILYGNNNGAKLEISPSTSAANAHRLYGDVYGRFLNKQIIVQLYGDYSSCDSTKNPKYNKNKSYTSTNTTFKVFAAYTGKLFTLGGEWFAQTQANGAVNSDSTIRNVAPTGFSVFANVPLINDKDTSKKTNLGAILSVFARYDSYNPDANLADGSVYVSNKWSKGVTYTAPNEGLIVAGLDWVVAKNVHITPNIEVSSYKNKTSKSDATNRSDSDMTARVTFFWKF